MSCQYVLIAQVKQKGLMMSHKNLASNTRDKNKSVDKIACLNFMSSFN